MGSKVGVVVAAAALACAATAGGAWWWVQQQTHQGAASQQAAPTIDMSQASYVTLDKVVVMLRSQEQGARTHNYYLAADLVLRTDKMHEKAVKAELPMLKGVAVQALSRMDVEQARSLGIEEWSALLQRELTAAYNDYPHLRLFDRVMVSRLIIE